MKRLETYSCSLAAVKNKSDEEQMQYAQLQLCQVFIYTDVPYTPDDYITTRDPLLNRMCFKLKGT
jgi:hypothetical protein